MKQHEILEESFLDKKPKQEISLLVALFWLIIFAIGYLFRIMHWPYSSMTILIGLAGFQSYCLNWFIKSKDKKRKINILNIIGLIILMRFILGAFLNSGSPFNLDGLIVYAIIFVIFFFIYLAIINRDKWIKRNL